MHKKAIIWMLLIATAVLIGSCDQFPEEGAAGFDLDLSGARAVGYTVDKVEVTLEHDATGNTDVHELSIVPGESRATGAIHGLRPGLWNITVNIFEGPEEIAVAKGSVLIEANTIKDVTLTGVIATGGVNLAVEWTVKAGADAYIDASPGTGDWQNTNYNNTVLKIANMPDATTYQIIPLLKFFVSSSTVAVQSARIRLYLYGEALNPQSFPTDLALHAITSEWDETTVTWNTRPTISSAEMATTPIGITAWPESTGTDYVEFDVTDLYNDWVTGTEDNFGVAVKATASTETWYKRDFVSFDSMEYNEYSPQLIVVP